MLTVLRHYTAQPFTSGCRVATGRSAILHMIRQHKTTVALMPCYVPDGVIKPFQAANVEIEFYHLQRDLSPDVKDVQRLLSVKAGAKVIVVAIQYFGWRQRFRALRQMVHDVGGILFEDCAHCICHGGEDGDVVLLSLNKFLPVPDGAIMVSRNAAVDVTVREPLTPLSDECIAAYNLHLLMNTSIANDGNIGEAVMASDQAYDVYYTHITDMVLHSQSAASRAAEAVTDLAKLAATREASAVRLSSMARTVAVRPFSPCHFALPIRCNGKRREIEAALYGAGVLAATLTDRWDHVQPGFHAEMEFFDDHLLLPLDSHIGGIAAVLNGFA